MQPQISIKPHTKILQPFIHIVFSLAGILIFIFVLPELEIPSHRHVILAFTFLGIISSLLFVQTFISGVSLNNAVAFSGIILYGPWAAVWATVIEVLIVAFLGRMSFNKVLPNLGQVLLTIWIVSLLNSWLTSFSLHWTITDPLLILIYWMINTFFCSVLISVGRNAPWGNVIKIMIKDSAMTYLLLMIVGELGARLVETSGTMVLIPLGATFIILSAVFRLYFSGLYKLENKIKEIKSLNNSFLTAVGAMIDARDPYTYGHSTRVAYWGKRLATAIGLPKKQIDEIYYGGVLHDMGKIGIEDDILNKEGRLTNEEFARIKEHPVIGYQILKQAGVFEELLPAVRSHHERVDGKGYPDGLSGDDIPLAARILAISDAFDAMVSDRPYRKGLPIETVLKQIEEGAGTQFDKELAHKFLQLVKSHSMEELLKLISAHGPKYQPTE